MPPTYPASSKAGGMCMVTMPDVCLTPSPAGPVPLPYPCIGMVNQAKKTSANVKIGGKEVVTKKSEISRSQGDEPGTNKGVVSGNNMGKIIYTKCSSKVKIEGQDCAHFTSMTSHNGSNANAPGSQIEPSQSDVLISS